MDSIADAKRWVNSEWILPMTRDSFHILIIIHFVTHDEQAFSRDNRFTGRFRDASVMDVKNRRWHGLANSAIISNNVR